MLADGRFSDVHDKFLWFLLDFRQQNRSASLSSPTSLFPKPYVNWKDRGGPRSKSRNWVWRRSRGLPPGVGTDGSRSESTSTSHTIVKGAQSAWDMLQEEETLVRITTSSLDFDNILGGGIICKEATEIGGVSGIGKTQLGIQLAVNVQIPFDYGGLGGKAIYIDTEGSFMVERALQIAEACGDDMAEYSRLYRKGSHSHEVKIQPKDFLENIFYFRVCSYTERIALINYLDKFIGDHKDVKVVIIDSITFHFRQDFDDMALRTRLLGGMALKLMKLAKRFGVAVVVLNQVTTKKLQAKDLLKDKSSFKSDNNWVTVLNGTQEGAYQWIIYSPKKMKCVLVEFTMYRLICKEAVEENILHRVSQKSIVQQLVMTGGHIQGDILAPVDVISLLIDDAHTVDARH
ncbi:hypothetical protein L2E82_05241 [Cichorium intybus]|uniref:Uncharacterized protein n=1 Tax=Cichorium intybus TaxID=13427 RepID=A0ACB9H893_CICIN|nr:hypothetical protein L2E82_05241 [Cichorium intybus]